jgi:molecular chaperone GrpE
MQKDDRPHSEDIEYVPVQKENPEGGPKEPAEPIKTEAKEERPDDKLGPEEIKSLKNKIRRRDSEIKLLKKEKEELKDKYIRTLADMDNLRKRLEREKSEFLQYALSELLRELLSVLDNFERALETREETDGKTFRDGIELIHKQFLDLLLKRGVSRLDVQGQKFDPAVHQAFLTQESEEIEEPMVGEELQKGYLLHTRLLRPALVKVLVPKKKE